MTDSIKTKPGISFGPHSMCLNCWDYVTHRAAPARVPMEDRQYEECCRCGLGTSSGIYTRSHVHLLYCPGHDSAPSGHDSAPSGHDSASDSDDGGDVA